MAKLAAPMISRIATRSKADSVFNEGISVPQAEWKEAVKRNPALDSKNKQERAEATKKAILGGELAKYRRR